MRWYVVHAYSGFEKQVMRALARAHRAESGLQDKFGEILVPAEEVVEMRAGKKRRSERKFFPRVRAWLRWISTTSAGTWLKRRRKVSGVHRR